MNNPPRCDTGPSSDYPWPVATAHFLCIDVYVTYIGTPLHISTAANGEVYEIATQHISLPQASCVLGAVFNAD
jgi:hypothetical protein